jgi:hypothetical protein
MLIIMFLKAFPTPKGKEQLFEMFGQKLCHSLLLYMVPQGPENNARSYVNHCYRKSCV